MVGDLRAVCLYVTSVVWWMLPSPALDTRPPPPARQGKGHATQGSYGAAQPLHRPNLLPSIFPSLVSAIHYAPYPPHGAIHDSGYPIFGRSVLPRVHG